MNGPLDEPKAAALSGELPPAPPEAAVGAPEDASARQVAVLELHRQLSAWTQHEPGARLGSDPDSLHQLRVAVRRIDAILSLFKEQLPADLVRARKAAKILLRTLGAARDYDVQLAGLDRYCATLTPAERTAAAPLRERLESDRAQARARMLRALDSESTQQWLAGLDRASAAAGPAPPESAAIVMPEQVRKRFRKLRKEVRGVGADSALEEFHVVRRRAKRLRYAIEPGTQLYGKPAEELLKALRRLQDGLGAHQDAHLAKQRLEAIAGNARAELPPETLFLMGRLAEHQLKVSTKARKTLDRTWSKVRGRRWRSLRTRMQALRDEARKAHARAQTTLPSAVTQDPQVAAAPAAPAQPLRH